MKFDLPEKRYYTIGEVAKSFEVNTSLLRYWEKEFKEIQPQKKNEWCTEVYSCRCQKHPTHIPSSQRKRNDH